MTPWRTRLEGELTLPDESAIRMALRRYLSERHSDKTQTCFLSELGLRRHTARADLAVVSHLLHGYEIKSDRDSLRRLENQIPVYSEIFDKVSIVVGPHHAKAVGSIVPDWWEILQFVAVPRPTFEVLRLGSLNPSPSARSLVELLWRDEAISLLESRAADRGYRRGSRKQIWDRICEVCTLGEIAEAVRAHLMARSMLGLVGTPA